MKVKRVLLQCLLAALAATSLISCASDETRRRERVAPTVTDSSLPWNRPQKWEGNARYGSMIPGSR